MNSMNTQARKMYKNELFMSLGRTKEHGKSAVVCGINLTVGNIKNILLLSLHNYLLEIKSRAHPKKHYLGLLPNGKTVSFTHAQYESKIISGSLDHELRGKTMENIIISNIKSLVRRMKHNPHVLRCTYSQLNCIELSILDTEVLMNNADSHYGLVSYDMLIHGIDPRLNKTTASESTDDIAKNIPHSKHHTMAVKKAKKTTNVPVSLKTVTDKHGIKSYRTSINMEVPENGFAINTILMGYLSIDHAFQNHQPKCTIKFLSGSKMSVDMGSLLQALNSDTISVFFSDEFESNMYSLMNEIMDQPPKLYLKSSQTEALYNIGVLLTGLAYAHGCKDDASLLDTLVPLLKNIEEYSVKHSPNIYVGNTKSKLNIHDAIKGMLKSKQLSTFGYENFGGDDNVSFCAFNLNVSTLRHVIYLASELYPSVFKTLNHHHSSNPVITLPNGYKHKAPSDLVKQLQPLVKSSHVQQLKYHVVPQLKKLKSKSKTDKRVLVLDKHQLLALSKAIKVTSLVTSCFEVMGDFHIYLNLIGLVIRLYNDLTANK